MSSETLVFLQRETVRLKEENERLRSEVQSLQQYVDAIQTLIDAIETWQPQGEVMPLLERILYNALTVLDSKDGSLLVLDDETGELVFVLVHGDVEESVLLGYRIPSGQGIAGWVAKNAKPTIVNNPSKDPRFLPSIDQAFDFKTESMLAAPIIGRGRVMGVIEVLNKHSGEEYTATDQNLLMLLCHLAGEVLHRLLTESNESQQQKKKAKEKPDTSDG